MYNKTQRDKFKWAIDMATEHFVFWCHLLHSCLNHLTHCKYLLRHLVKIILICLLKHSMVNTVLIHFIIYILCDYWWYSQHFVQISFLTYHYYINTEKNSKAMTSTFFAFLKILIYFEMCKFESMKTTLKFHHLCLSFLCIP